MAGGWCAAPPRPPHQRRQAWPTRPMPVCNVAGCARLMGFSSTGRARICIHTCRAADDGRFRLLLQMHDASPTTSTHPNSSIHPIDPTAKAFDRFGPPSIGTGTKPRCLGVAQGAWRRSSEPLGALALGLDFGCRLLGYARKRWRRPFARSVCSGFPSRCTRVPIPRRTQHMGSHAPRSPARKVRVQGSPIPRYGARAWSRSSATGV